VEESERFLEALEALEEVADRVSPEEAHRHFDEASLQVFWRKWPDLSAWAARLWRLLNEELAAAAVPVAESEDHDVGGGG
jgi:hypothetical protein